MPGHVFLLHGDLTRLACDAWLMPTDHRLRVLPTWRKWPPGAPPRIPSAPPSAAWTKSRRRVLKVAPAQPDFPTPWLVNVGAGDKARTEWFVEGAAEFLDAVAKDLAKTPPRHGRARHLVALPLVGTGQGGAAAAAGAVVRQLLPVLARAAKQHRYDVALVVLDDAAFAAAQAERKRSASAWPALDADARALADDLAEKASRGDLVLFLGAGVSAAAGLPLWQSLIDDLAKRAMLSDDERKDLRRLDTLDQAWFIERKLEARSRAKHASERQEAARRAIADRTRAWHASLVHFALAALPASEIITTNYDQLFEFASRGLGCEISVIPHDLDPRASRWILKMHGSVTHPEDIVLTREDFMRYEQRRAALAGIVQALLITRHMLFVGFSLNDENFHRIADSVRRALGVARGQNGRRPTFGTVLALEKDPLLHSLWERDLDVFPMGDAIPSGPGRGAALAERARRLEIFCDYLLSRTSRAPSHLLDDRFREVLTGDERALRDHVRVFVEGLPEAAKRGAAWKEIRALIQKLGGHA